GRCIRQVSSRASSFDRRDRLFVFDRRFLFPGGPFRETLHRDVLRVIEFQRRADRIPFRSPRAYLGCFLSRPVMFLYWYLRSAKRLTAITPLSLFTYSF